MKTRFFIITLLFLAACQPVEQVYPVDASENSSQEQDVCTLSVNASLDAGTKALELTDGGGALKAYWAGGEQISVFTVLMGRLMHLGYLTATPVPGNRKMATLTGDIPKLTVGRELILLFPGRTNPENLTLDYTGQDGAAPTPDGNLATQYNFALASVAVSGYNPSTRSYYTTGATFTNLQSVYRFGFIDGGRYIDPKVFFIDAASGKLVRTLDYRSKSRDWSMPAYGILSVTPAAAPADHFYYLALRNENSSKDERYGFTLVGAGDDALYMGCKDVPKANLGQGKFISAKTVAVSRPDFRPATGTPSANTWTVTSSTDGNATTFTITRSGNTAIAERVQYRTVSLSALASVNYDEKTGELTFNAGEAQKSVTIMEKDKEDIELIYRVQKGGKRSYRFEVNDLGGFSLAYADREIDYGNPISNIRLFGGKHKKEYTFPYTVTQYGREVYDLGYGHNSINDYLRAASTCFYGEAEQEFLVSVQASLYTHLWFDAREKYDGYQYIQVLADTDEYDSEARDGDPGKPVYSLYSAGFSIHGDPEQDYYHDFRELNLPCARASGHACGFVQNGMGDYADLMQQYFGPDGKTYAWSDFLLDVDFHELIILLDASGYEDDTWLIKNLKVSITAADNISPTVLDNYMVSGGKHAKGNVIYVSIPFSEMVTVADNPTLETSWGTLTFISGYETNVLTFGGTISPDASGPFTVYGYTGTIRDLYFLSPSNRGNDFTGDISHDFGITLDDDEISLAQGTKDGVSAWWGTYYNSSTNYRLSEGAAAYTMDSNHRLYRLGEDGRIIPKNTAVVIIATEVSTASITPCGTGDLNITDHAPGGNILRGSDELIAVSEIAGSPCCFGFDSATSTVGFFSCSDNAVNTISARTAYYLQ